MLNADRSFMKTFAKLICPGIVLAAFLCLIGCGKEEEKPAPQVTVQAAPVEKEDISRVVNAGAVIFPLAQSAITPKINAPVRKFYVVRAQKVRQGQLLATLENRDLSAARLDNQGAYEQAQAAYATNVQATLPEDVQKSQLDVENAQKALDAAQKPYTSREQL